MVKEAYTRGKDRLARVVKEAYTRGKDRLARMVKEAYTRGKERPTHVESCTRHYEIIYQQFMHCLSQAFHE